ncbi:MAG: ATP-binding protein [Muribaculaceae bacterium]|nr:ATP-binding protein [Muribaculaceae bacterium]
MEENVKYPIGEQDFKKIREEGFLYVDKTRFIETVLRSGSRYYFLARPRRFGKSLFLSTLQYFFEGKRDLFKGLYIDLFDWDWKAYPVLRLDLNKERYAEPDKLEDVLDKIFRQWENKFDIIPVDSNFSQRFETIIEQAHIKTGKQVVVLVDEYDKPLVGNLSKEENFEYYRSQLAALYSNFKSSAEHLKLVFLTGVSRFSKLSVFSDLNNLNDISFDDKYADICGITIQESRDYCHAGIRSLAKKENMTFDEAFEELRRNYDGYKFAGDGSEIFNPWSLFNALEKEKMENFWNETGLPTIVAESLKRVNSDLQQTFDTYCTESELKGLDLLNPDPIALLYQTGYLTIKEYIRKLKRFRLGIPNNEVKEGLFKVLVPYYVKTKTNSANSIINDIVVNFILGEPEKSMKGLQVYFAGIDYALKIDNENNFHNAFFLLLDLIGLETKAESHTSEGRIDIEITTDDFIYIIELKYDHSAEKALQQIKENHYARKYQNDSRRLFEIGVEFSSKTRCIENWIID